MEGSPNCIKFLTTQMNLRAVETAKKQGFLIDPFEVSNNGINKGSICSELIAERHATHH